VCGKFICEGPSLDPKAQEPSGKHRDGKAREASKGTRGLTMSRESQDATEWTKMTRKAHEHSTMEDEKRSHRQLEKSVTAVAYLCLAFQASSNFDNDSPGTTSESHTVVARIPDANTVPCAVTSVYRSSAVN
jgi:hypothetical protein